MNYREAVRYILDIPKFTKKNPIDNTKALLKMLGNPQQNMNIIHVAGTNGKGSVCAFIDSILRNAQKRTGMFTSPHLVTINERFIINGEMISDEVFLNAFNTVKNAIDRLVEKGYSHSTFFEFLFGMAMVIFSRESLDYVLIEAGLGGRLDSTNALSSPVLSVITTIGLDHMEVLGSTIEAIAREKAGIIKPKIPVIFDGTDKNVRAVIIEEAVKKECCYCYLTGESDMQVDAENTFCYKINNFENKNIDFLLNYGYYGYINVSIGGIGDYQVKNASLAAMAVKHIDKSIEDGIIQQGIANARWAGRMEEVLPNVYLDGAHNYDAIVSFVNTVSHFNGCRKVLLFSAVEDKAYKSMIDYICQNTDFDEIIITEIDNNRAAPSKVLSKAFKESMNCTDGRLHVIERCSEAFKLALDLQREGYVFCAGSLYLIGELKETLISGDYN